MAKEIPLAENRKMLLKQILRYRYFDIFLLSLSTFIFILPGIIYLLFANEVFLVTDNIYSIFFAYIVYIPFWCIAGLGFAGGFYFCKRLAFGEGANVMKDFFEGIKKNAKTFLLIYLILGSVYAFLKTGIYFCFSTLPDGVLPYLIAGIGYAVFLLLLIVSLYCQTQTIIYNCSFKQLFLNGIRFCVGKILTNYFLIGILFFPFIIIEFSIIDILTWICYFILLIFYLGFSLISYTFYSHSLFDQSINKANYPTIYRKGLNKHEH